ncbi:hypothetical protein MIMGU_mgv1a024241mg [Erythranthe guttata]|uniref:Uncharacterized protein n=1 Tax=Erythranthe guttata TaxID=4155 RepID=A0A022Q4V5_ERYGU|nr:hypothetical protein MIMGU_mgv1a024241mg [Erythranthe guttata]
MGRRERGDVGPKKSSEFSHTYYTSHCVCSSNRCRSSLTYLIHRKTRPLPLRFREFSSNWQKLINPTSARIVKIAIANRGKIACRIELPRGWGFEP